MNTSDPKSATKSFGAYQSEKLLYQSSKTLVYLGHHYQSGEQVIIKMPSEADNESGWERIQDEVKLLQELDIEGVPKVLDSGGMPVMIRPFLPGITLKEYLGSLHDGLRLNAFFSLALQLTEMVGKVHRAGVIHRDINPHNILLDAKVFRLYLIDFGIASRYDQRAPSNIPPRHIEGVLAYISPEQTGRMNRGVDYRSDLYSLGVVFYEMLAHRLPFKLSDPIELVHAHLAITPPPLSEFRQDIPPRLAELVQKLLAKDPVKRYQSADGLLYDLQRLEEVSKGLLANREIVLGKEDTPLRFDISGKLYGREQETRELLNAFANVQEGGKELLLIGGRSGVGKSALVAEIYKPVTAAKGLFLSGKFDQLQRSITHFAWRQAFSNMANILLSESEEVLGQWRGEFRQALGKNGRIITDLSPEMERVIGTQPELPEQDAAGMLNRFLLVLKRTVKVLAQPVHPLVIFLDDWQWADQASISLLQSLYEDPSLDHVLFICAYRDNEVDSDHPFALAIQELENKQQKLGNTGLLIRQQLKNLEQEDVQQLLEDTLQQAGPEVQTFAQQLHSKTLGNAFFVHQLLKSLYVKKVIYPQRDQDSRFSWGFDLEVLPSLGITDNVVSFMVEKISEVPALTHQVLQLGSVIGNTFGAGLLQHILGIARDQLLGRMQYALAEGLVVPLNTQPGQEPLYKFGHDSIRQAFYQSIPSEQRKEYHLAVGQQLEERLSHDWKANILFDAVNAYNAAQSLITDPALRSQVAQLNYQAAHQAQNAAAYATALNYALAGIGYLGQQSWAEDYELTRDLHREALENAYYLGGLKETEEWLNLLLTHARSTLDKALALEIKMEYFKAAQQYDEAFEVGVEINRLLGIKLKKPNIPNILLSIFGAKYRLDRKGLDNLLEYPYTKSAMAETQERALLNLGIVVYFSRPEYLPVLAPAQVQVMLRNGHTIYSPYTYMSFALNMIAGLGNIAYCYRLGQLGEKLAGRLKPTKLEGRTGFLHRHFVRHWLEPASQVAKAQRELYYRCIEIGDFEFATYAAISGTKMSFAAGMPIRRIKKQSAIWQKEITEKLGLPSKHNEYLAVHAVSAWLTEDDTAFAMQDGSPYDEVRHEAELKQVNNKSSLSGLFWGRMMGWMVLNNPEKAWHYCGKFEEYVSAAIATVDWVFYHFAKSMIIMVGLEQQVPGISTKELRFVKKAIGKFRKWGKQTPENYAFYQWMLEAELARYKNDSATALKKYNQAIELASNQQHIQIIALANERAASLARKDEQKTLFRFYLSEAYRYFQKWGSPLKIKQLDAEFKEVLQRNTTESTSGENSESSRYLNLDLVSIIRSSQAISSQIVLDKLLEQMLELIMENAGAQRGLLLLYQDRTLRIQGEINLREAHRSFLQDTPLDHAMDKAPRQILYYVARSQKRLVESNPQKSGTFAQDSYFDHQSPRNVLALPLLKQKEVRGILYLEHYDSPDVFVARRLETIELLSTQMTISLENALLYDDLENQVASRTREVTQQKALIEEQKMALQTANDKVMSSIRYAKDIQTAMLMPLAKVSELLPDSFILYKPRDVVSGDFYWVREWKGMTYVAAVDCTGHGVPGALVSMIANNLLDEILTTDTLGQPAQMLDELQILLSKSLRYEAAETRIGMDMAIVSIDPKTGTLQFAGAKSPLLLFQDGKMHYTKGDRMSIGIDRTRRKVFKDRHFTNHIFSYRQADRHIPTQFYLFSDGFADQFGGEEKTKYSSARFRQILSDIHTLPAEEQQAKLEAQLQGWMLTGQEAQIDDVLVIGVRV